MVSSSLIVEVDIITTDSSHGLRLSEFLLVKEGWRDETII